MILWKGAISEMLLAAHQPNFMPWLPYFAKIQRADVFVLMINCQFEKNAFQNRAWAWDRWLTKPVESGNDIIKGKKYAGGSSLSDVNVSFILSMCKILEIDTKKIHFDFETNKKGTDRIIELCSRFGCSEYLSNPEATDKYLDIKSLNDHGIDFVPFMFPYKKHLFEALQEFGLEGTIKLLNKNYDPIRVS